MKQAAVIGLTVLFSLVFCIQIEAAEISGADGTLDALIGNLAEFDTEEIQDFLNSMEEPSLATVSFRDLMEELLRGNLMKVFEDGAAAIKSILFSELKTNVGWIGQIFILAVIGAVFSGFSGIFGSGYISDTGFYMVYLLAMAFLVSGFFTSVNLASEVLQTLLEFMKVLLPAYFMAMVMAGSAITSTAVCGFTLGAIGLIQSVLGQILIPFMRIYMIFILAGNLYKEDMISKLTELLGTVVVWTCRAMFGIVVGFQMIQSLVLPQADALKNSTALHLVQMIPGLGSGAGAVSQMVLGSGVLIKNTIGAASVVLILLLSAIPVIKLAVLTGLYYMAAAAMQPVCDKRLVACMNGAAQGHSLLLKIVGYSLALFSVTIAVLCVSTNAVWYTG